MDDVKRYDLEQPDSHMGSAKMQREDCGDWVSFEDYTALRARLEAVEKERDLAVAQNDRLWAANHRLVSTADAETERADAAMARAELAPDPRVVALVQRIEQYDFSCEAGSLRQCTEWLHLKEATKCV